MRSDAGAPDESCSGVGLQKQPVYVRGNGVSENFKKHRGKERGLFR